MFPCRPLDASDYNNHQILKQYFKSHRGQIPWHTKKLVRILDLLRSSHFYQIVFFRMHYFSKKNT